MKRHISNESTKAGQGLLFFVGLAITSLIAVFLIDKDFSLSHFLLQSLGILCLIGFWYYYSNGRFYNVYFDNDFVYFSRFKHSGQIRLENIIMIQPGILPFRLSLKNVYIVTIIFLDNDKERKIKFLSKGIGVAGTIDEIPCIDLLKQQIKEKKYGR